MELAQIVPIVIAVVAAVPGVLALISEGSKIKVDAQKVAQEAAIDIINPLREEMKALRIRVGELETLLKAKDARIDELEKTIANMMRITQEKILDATAPLLEEALRLRNDRVNELKNLATEKNRQISALERDIDRRNTRIKVLESNAKTAESDCAEAIEEDRNGGKNE